jgi:formate dehydrogenase
MAGDARREPEAFPARRGDSRRRALAHPKGRQVAPAALDEIRALLGDRPRRRDLLIEHLHLVQDRYGCIRPAHLAAVAHEMRLSQAEVYEVATFYAHFDVLGESDPPPPPLTVRVCDGVSCILAGGERLREGLSGRLGPRVRVVPVPCIGRCNTAPVAFVGRRHVDRATADSVAAAVASGTFGSVPPDGTVGYEAYAKDGGYRVLRECLAGGRSRDAVVEAVESSALRGLGGAGFRSGQKWRLVRQEPKPRLLAVNADEGEPGTFKDRVLLETDPHRVLEGMLVAAWAVEAEEVYIYLRDEYPHLHELLRRELALVSAAGLAGPRVELRRGAGAYICGEETAMLESIEGRRGYPRHKPPFPTQVGLFGRPTLIHNVETLYWVRDVLERGPSWLDAQGRNGRKGLRHFSVSGRVKEPGVKRAPAGITARQLIDEYCGGMAEGHAFKAYLPGGASGGILPARLADLPLDFGTLEPYGCFVGSAAVVVLSDKDDVRAVALNLMRFFADESCGQCTPCRVGTEKAAALMDRPDWDGPLLAELSAAMRDASICGLGQAAPNPLLSVLRDFPEDLR